MPPTKMKKTAAAKAPVILAYVTQGKTEHMVSIVDPIIKDGNSSLSLTKLKQDSELLIKWSSTGQEQLVIVSSIRLMDVDDGRSGRRRGSQRTSASVTATSPSKAIATASSSSSSSSSTKKTTKTTTSPKKGPSTLMKKTTKPSLSNYERLRLERIKRNQEYLQQLGLEQFKIAPTDKIKKTKKKIKTRIITPRQQPHRSGKKRIREIDVILPPTKKKRKALEIEAGIVFQPLRRYSKRIQENQHNERSTAVDSEDDQDEYKDIPSMAIFQRNTAMKMSDVITRMLEIDIVTSAQVALPGFSIRLAEKSDLSASTKKELQQQTLRLCKYGLLARWVLQDDGESRVLQIVRCSGIEGHHPSTRSSWANKNSSPTQRNHELYNNGPLKKDSFFSTKPKWLMKTCSRNRHSPLDRAPFVHGEQQNVECLLAVSNGCQQAFGAPTKDAMNGEVKLTTGVLGLNTQDGVDMILNTPIFNDGSNGKLVLLIIGIEEPSNLKPMLHAMSNRKKKSTFMAAKNVILHGNRTSDQSRALENKIYRMQRANGLLGYEKGLGLFTYEERLAIYEKGLGLLTYEERLEIYEKGLGLLTKEQHSANGMLGYAKGLALTKYYCPPPTITMDGMHDLALDDVVVQANYGTGTVKSVQKPSKKNEARAKIEFKDKQVGLKYVTINSLSCNGQRCQFAFVCNELDGQWMGMYQKLVAYKKSHKSTRVPQDYKKDPELGNWVRRQRTFDNKKGLSIERTHRLESIGFAWDLLDAQWMEMYQKLVVYKKQYRSTKVPYRYTEDPQLGLWVKRQRGLYKKNKLSDKRTDLLNSLNFV